MRYIELDAAMNKRLRKIRKTDSRHRVRDRAHSILLSSQGMKMEEIAAIFSVDRDTISEWFNRWESQGVDGLYDRPHSGRPPSLDKVKKKLNRSSRDSSKKS